jgi:hypothetical protein
MAVCRAPQEWYGPGRDTGGVSLDVSTKGPAPRGEYSGKSDVLSTRIRPDTREHLEGAARVSGRSLSQEIEHRLRRSFVEDEQLAKVFGSRRNFALMRIIASIIETVEGHRQDWFRSPERYELVERTVGEVLHSLRPISRNATTGTARLSGEKANRIRVELHHLIVDMVEAAPSLALQGPRSERLLVVLREAAIDYVLELYKQELQGNWNGSRLRAILDRVLASARASEIEAVLLSRAKERPRSRGSFGRADSFAARNAKKEQT